MGYAITWCAVPEEAADRLLSHLGLLPTGQSEQYPQSRFSSAKLTTGWRLIWSNKYNCPVLMNALATFVSDYDAVACQIEEHVMASSAELWRNGSRRWRLSHEGIDGPKGLESDGTLPQSYGAIRKEMEDAQLAEGGEAADVDYIFEIPLKVAQSLVGFKHDENYGAALESDFMILSNRNGEKSFLSRFFGK